MELMKQVIPCYFENLECVYQVFRRDTLPMMLLEITRRMHQVPQHTHYLTVIADIRAPGIPVFRELKASREPAKLLSDAQELEQFPLKQRLYFAVGLVPRHRFAASYFIWETMDHRHEDGLKRTTEHHATWKIGFRRFALASLATVETLKSQHFIELRIV